WGSDRDHGAARRPAADVAGHHRRARGAAPGDGGRAGGRHQRAAHGNRERQPPDRGNEPDHATAATADGPAAAEYSRHAAPLTRSSPISATPAQAGTHRSAFEPSISASRLSSGLRNGFGFSGALRH